MTLVGALALLCPGWASVAPVLYIFGVVPVLDRWIGTFERNPAADEAARWRQPRVWAAILYSYVVTHFAMLGFALWTAGGLSWGLVGVIGLATGLYTGGLGITVAHEFSHKTSRVFYATAAVLLATVWYHHFLIEHTRGHHLRVATPEDPASAHLGEGAYRFVIRSLRGGFLGALELERLRVGRIWSWRNQVTAGVVAQIALTLILAAVSAKVVACFLIQSAVAIVLLELINYIEHYGLSRARTAGGRFERVAPRHSWNSSHRFTNAIFFNLQRHSDHHAAAVLPFTLLKHHHAVPQLPFGYPTMVLIALCPPLWFRVMDPRVRRWDEATARGA
jgi:alkane 1-monooxygenase